MNSNLSRRQFVGLLGATAYGSIGSTSKEPAHPDLLDSFQEARRNVNKFKKRSSGARIPLKNVNDIDIPDIERKIPLKEENISKDVKNVEELYKNLKDSGKIPEPRNNYESLVFEDSFRVTIHPLKVTGAAEDLLLADRSLSDLGEEAKDFTLNEAKRIMDGDIRFAIKVAEEKRLEKDSEEFDSLKSLGDPYGMHETFFFLPNFLSAPFGDLNSSFEEEEGSLSFYITNMEFDKVKGIANTHGLGAAASAPMANSIPEFNEIVAHEIPHGFGADHSAYRESLMSNPYNPKSEAEEYGWRTEKHFERLIDGETEYNIVKRENSEENSEKLLIQRFKPHNIKSNKAEEEMGAHAKEFLSDVHGFNAINDMLFKGVSMNQGTTTLRYEDERDGVTYNLEVHMDKQGYLDDIELFSI